MSEKAVGKRQSMDELASPFATKVPFLSHRFLLLFLGPPSLPPIFKGMVKHYPDFM